MQYTYLNTYNLKPHRRSYPDIKERVTVYYIGWIYLQYLHKSLKNKCKPSQGKYRI